MADKIQWCQTARGKQWLKRYYSSPEQRQKLYGRHIKRKYGITLPEYDELLKKQQNRCAICSTHQADLRIALGVDHCHGTGLVRGLLCDPCNRALGLFKDSVGALSKAIDYLQSRQKEN